MKNIFDNNYRRVSDGEFYTLDQQGNLILRDLKKENSDFTVQKYFDTNEFDSYNYLYYENFEFEQFDSHGSDYERYGCQIESGMSVMDLGANIGAFARYASNKGAKEVFCFEPMTPTFHLLQLNTHHDEKIHPFKLGVSDKTGLAEFKIHSDPTHNGGGTMMKLGDSSLNIHFSEYCALIGIQDIFNDEKWSKIDFLKVDIEGAEQIVLEALPDEALRSIACISSEFHCNEPEFEIWQRNFIRKCQDFGFKSFVLYHGDGSLRTVTLWKD